MRIEKPQDVEVSLSATMTAAEWETIRDWLREAKAQHYQPVSRFASAIDDLLGQTRKLLWAKEEKSE